MLGTEKRKRTVMKKDGSLSVRPRIFVGIVSEGNAGR